MNNKDVLIINKNKRIFDIDQIIFELNKQIDEILIEYEQNQVVYEQLLEKTDNFQIDIENLFDKIKDPFRLNEQQINKITLICRKANENENFRYLLHNVNIYNNHPKIFFKKIDNMVEILGDKDMLDGSLEQQTNEENKINGSTLEIPKFKNLSFIECPKKTFENDKISHLMNEVKNMVEESIFHFVDERNIDKPHKILQKLISLRDKYLIDPKIGKFFAQIFEENNGYFMEIIKEFDQMCDFLKQTEAEDWIHEKSKDKIHVYYKIPKGTPTCSLKFEAELEVPIKNLASIIYECDLMNCWVPFCKRSSTIKKINKACKAFYVEIELPLVSNRETHCVGYGINRLEENGTLFIVARSIDQDQDYQKKYDLHIPNKTKLVRMDINYYIIEVTPLTENHLKIKMITNINPKFKVIPYSFINFCTRKFGIQIFETLLSKATKGFEKSEWHKLMFQEDNADFYKWIDTSILPFLKKK